MPHAISFLLNGEPAQVADLAPQTTLLQYLRERRGLTGTKEGCAEGDCGACTVVLAEVRGDRLAWRPVNACIRLLPSVHGKAVYTVESLRCDDGQLHPVQRALVESHGSQCGFCTPGFVMSLFGLYKNAWQATRAQCASAVSGNLCRCTGYRPILDAARAMYELPSPSGWRRACADSESQAASERPIVEALGALPRGTLDYDAEGQRWIAPATLREAAAACAATPRARIVAGATDLALRATKQHQDLGDLVYTGDVAELARIERDDGTIAIGGSVTLTDAFAALEQEWPETAEAWDRFASVPIRNSATLAGNIANGSPIGDSMPVLIALGAELELASAARMRHLPLESFYLDYQKTALEPGELVTRLRVPRRRDGLHLRAYKISKRHDQDISAVFACFAIGTDGSTIDRVRIGCGGVAPVPARAQATERELAGRPFAFATFDRAAQVLAREFTPIDDMRASARYRATVLGNLLRRFAHECVVDRSAPTRVDELLADHA